MALFSDGIATIEDLAGQDSAVLATAEAQNINLTQKLALAKQDVGVEIRSLLERRTTYDWQSWLLRDPHLKQVVVTVPLQQWHVFHTLELVYRDVYYNQ